MPMTYENDPDDEGPWGIQWRNHGTHQPKQRPKAAITRGPFFRDDYASFVLVPQSSHASDEPRNPTDLETSSGSRKWGTRLLDGTK